MSVKYGEPLLFKPQNVCKQSGRIKVLSVTNKVEDGIWKFSSKISQELLDLAFRNLVQTSGMTGMYCLSKNQPHMA